MSDSYCQMKWTILLSLFAFSNASTELNCPFWQPFDESSSCESCSEYYFRKFSNNGLVTPTANESNLANSLIYLPYNSDVLSANDCVCPLIFADKWCKPCAKPTQWQTMNAEDVDLWNKGFAHENECNHVTPQCRGECEDVNLQDGKYYYIKPSGKAYYEVDCPEGTYSDSTFDNRVKLRTTFISDFALNLDVGDVGSLYDSFRTIATTSGRTFTSESHFFSSFRDYHFYSRVCQVCPQGEFSTAGQGACSTSCPEGMFKLADNIPHEFIEGTMGKCVDACPDDHIVQGDECVKINCDPNHFLQDGVCVDCPVGYISDGKTSECQECSFVSQQGTACPWDTDVLSDLYKDMSGCADEQDS